MGSPEVSRALGHTCEVWASSSLCVCYSLVDAILPYQGLQRFIVIPNLQTTHSLRYYVLSKFCDGLYADLSDFSALQLILP